MQANENNKEEKSKVFHKKSLILSNGKKKQVHFFWLQGHDVTFPNLPSSVTFPDLKSFKDFLNQRGHFNLLSGAEKFIMQNKNRVNFDLYVVYSVWLCVRHKVLYT